MNSTVFAVAVVSVVVGAIGGYLVKHFQDSRHFNEIFADLFDMSIALDRKDKEIASLKEQVNRYNKLRAIKEIHVRPEVSDTVKKLMQDGCNVEFFKVDDLPDSLNDDIDFGGNF